MTTKGPVVVAFSASAAAAAALRWGAAESRRRDAPLLVLHVDDRGPRGGTLAGGLLQRDRSVDDRVAERVHRVLGDTLLVDQDIRPPLRVCVRRGPLVEVLRDAASDADVLVVGRADGCRHDRLPDELRACVDCPVVVVPA